MFGRGLRATPRTSFRPYRRSANYSAPPEGGVFLNWTAPTLDEEGGATDLSSYTVQYGAYEGDVLGETIGISAGATSYNVALLAPSGTWWFQVIAVSSNGAQSMVSAAAEKTVP